MVGGSELSHAPTARPERTESDNYGAPLTVTADVSEIDWNAYVESHPDATADHLWQWRGIFERVFRQECSYLAARRGGTLAGVLPLVRFRSRLFGRFVVSVPYLNYGGILASDTAAAHALIGRATAVARDFGASHLELRHRNRQAPELACRQHKVGMLLRLPASVDELWKALDRKVRNQVRKAQKEGLTTVRGGVDLVHEFYPIFARNMRDLGTPVYPRELFDSTLRVFSNQARVHVVRHGEIPVAAAIDLSFAGTVLVPWASSLRKYRPMNPNMLLYWSMLEQAVAGGARVFDFGRSTIGAGTHHFKQQWGANEIPLHWEYVLLTRAEPPDHGPGNSRFNIAIDGWKRLPLWLANRVGPRIVKNIP